MTAEKMSLIQHINKRSMMSASLTSLLKILPMSSIYDPQRIFVTGISNGAMMSYRLAIEIPEKIAAIAPVAGALPIDLVTYNISNVPISVCVMSGTHDPLVPWEGGLVGFPRNPRGIVLSGPHSVMYWVGQIIVLTLKSYLYFLILTQRPNPRCTRYLPEGIVTAPRYPLHYLQRWSHLARWNPISPQILVGKPRMISMPIR